MSWSGSVWVGQDDNVPCPHHCIGADTARPGPGAGTGQRAQEDTLKTHTKGPTQNPTRRGQNPIAAHSTLMLQMTWRAGYSQSTHLVSLTAACKGHDQRGTAHNVGTDAPDRHLLKQRHGAHPFAPRGTRADGGCVGVCGGLDPGRPHVLPDLQRLGPAPALARSPHRRSVGVYLRGRGGVSGARGCRCGSRIQG